MPEPFVIQPRAASAIAERALPPRATVTADAGLTIPVQPPSATSAYRAHPALATISAYLDDPLVTDVFANGATGLFVDRGSGAIAVTGWRAAEADVRALAVALVGLGGRHIDHASPCVDVRLDDGVRVHAVLPPVAADGTAISI